MDFYSAVRANGHSIEVKVNSHTGIACSNGFTRDKNPAKWLKANGSLPDYLRLLLALPTAPTMSTETAFKSAHKVFLTAEKAMNVNKSVPEGEFNADDCDTALTGLYDRRADEQAAVRGTNSEIAGLKGYIKKGGAATPTAKVKTLSKTAAIALIMQAVKAGNIAGLSPEVIATANAVAPAKK